MTHDPPKTFLRRSGILGRSGVFLWIVLLFSLVRCPSLPSKGWESVPRLLERITPPTIPDRDFLITEFGAIPDGQTDCTEAIRAAIAACHGAGGGRVVVPEGRYLTGPIHLASRINLHLERGATLLFKKDPRAYLPVVFTRVEGVECWNYSPFVYALDAEDIAITGEGTLDGQAGPDAWWPWTGKEKFGWKPGDPTHDADLARLYRFSVENTPLEERLFGEGHYLRPNFIQTYRCRNVLIEGITILRSPMWEIHPVLCENVIVRNVTVISHGPNNDGCNPESSRRVLIESCYFDTGDDCIAIKSGRNGEGRRIGVPSEDILIRNCTMRDGHGGVVIGSEMSGDCRNIFVEDCVMDSPHLDRALRIKTNSLRGGVVENIYMRRVRIGEVDEAVVHIYFHYGEGDVGPFFPIVRNIHLEAVTSQKSRYAIYIDAYARSPVTGLYLKSCAFEGVSEGNVLRHVRGLYLEDVTLNGLPLHAEDLLETSEIRAP